MRWRRRIKGRGKLEKRQEKPPIKRWTDDGSIINSTPIDEGLNDDAYRRLLYIAVVEDQYKEY